MLADALINHSTWLDQLRKDDGIRDILIHKPHLLQIGPHGNKAHGAVDWSWRITAHLIRGMPGSLKAIDLFPALLGCILGLCRFMERLYRCVGGNDGYEIGDVVFLTGLDNNVIGFWPSIIGEQSGFPHLD